MSRIGELAQAAARAFEECSDPFSTAWLVEHEVTSDECWELSQHISAAIVFYESVPPYERGIFAVKAHLEREGQPELAKAFEENAKAAQALRHLKDRTEIPLRSHRSP